MECFDVFLFPSLFEGLPVTMVEAQAAGLQCLISDSLTEEVDITQLVSRLRIDLPPQIWAEKILQDLMPDEDTVAEGQMHTAEQQRTTAYAIGDRMGSSGYITDQIRKAGFDVKTQAMMMTYFYENGHF